jgi:hypothetical protein
MSTYKQKFNLKYGFKKDESHTLPEISKITGYKLAGLKKIAEKGRGAFYTNPQSVRPVVKKSGGATRWGIARVYAAIMGSETLKFDKNLLVK